MRILIIVEGGLVQHVLADAPIKVLTIDYDIGDADISGDETVAIPQGEGRFADAYVSDPMVDVNPERTAELFALVPA